MSIKHWVEFEVDMEGGTHHKRMRFPVEQVTGFREHTADRTLLERQVCHQHVEALIVVLPYEEVATRIDVAMANSLMLGCLDEGTVE